MKVKSQALRDAARNEDCTFQIVGMCNSNPETTVLAHLPDETNGMGIKSCDLSAAFGCSACHDVIDGRVNNPLPKAEREWYMRRAQTRTWRRFVELGLVKIKGYK